MQRKNFKRVATANSTLEGYGLFALENINKGDFIMEYVGEIIDIEEAEERDKWNQIEMITYLFRLNETVKKLNFFFIKEKFIF